MKKELVGLKEMVWKHKLMEILGHGLGEIQMLSLHLAGRRFTESGDEGGRVVVKYCCGELCRYWTTIEG